MNTNIENTNERICSICGCVIEDDEYTELDSGEVVCNDCRDDECGYCEHCGQWFHYDELQYVNEDTCGEERWCYDCVENNAYRCDRCGSWFTFAFIHMDSFGNQVCDDCYEAHYYTCEDCGRIIHVDDSYSIDEDHSLYCYDCWQNHEEETFIHGYGYKPFPDIARRKGEADDALTFGVELEVDDGDEPEDDTAKAVTEAAEGRIYCKHDGSLDSGFEIVSHPATLAHHMYETRWPNIMRICGQAGYKSHDTDTCGLHIHVGRRGLGGNPEERYDTALKLVVLTQALQDKLVPFTRRKASRLAQWAAFSDIDLTLGEEDLKYQAEQTRGQGRYQAVNLQNYGTVEFRIFRGTLQRSTLIASMQLVSNMCHYAMAHSFTECANAAFADVVVAHHYDELLAYCVGRGLLKVATTVAG